jgi:hypothetical protein
MSTLEDNILVAHDPKKDGPEGLPHGLINYKDTKTKCRHSKKFTWDFTAGPGRIDSSESIPGLHKRLQIRALATGYPLPFSSVNAKKVLNATK